MNMLLLSLGLVFTAITHGCATQTASQPTLTQGPIAYISVTPMEAAPGSTVVVTFNLTDDDGDMTRYRVWHVGYRMLSPLRAQVDDGAAFDSSYRYTIPANARPGQHQLNVEVWDKANHRGHDMVLFTVTGR